MQLSNIKALFVLLFAIAPFWLVGQADTDWKGKLTPDETRVFIGNKQIRLLKNGVLLVRLQSRSTLVEALKARGDSAQATKITAQQYDKNLSIAKAFQHEFNFCPVYFFYAEESKYVKDRQWALTTLLDHRLTPAKDTQIFAKNFMVAEFGRTLITDSDTFTLHYLEDGDWTTEIFDHPGGAETNFGALVLMSNQFQQLFKPFPYYVRTFEDVPWRRRDFMTVRRLNRFLNEYASFRRL